MRVVATAFELQLRRSGRPLNGVKGTFSRLCCSRLMLSLSTLILECRSSPPDDRGGGHTETNDNKSLLLKKANLDIRPAEKLFHLEHQQPLIQHKCVSLDRACSELRVFCVLFKAFLLCLGKKLLLAIIAFISGFLETSWHGTPSKRLATSS